MPTPTTVIARWKIHTPRLLMEVLNNPTASILAVPINALGKLLGAVGDRAAQLNDPILNDLMCQLTIYEIADPYSKHHSPDLLKQVEDKANQHDASITPLGALTQAHEALQHTLEHLTEDTRGKPNVGEITKAIATIEKFL